MPVECVEVTAARKLLCYNRGPFAKTRPFFQLSFYSLAHTRSASAPPELQQEEK